jgi:signal transduction histidine kinase
MSDETNHSGISAAPSRLLVVDDEESIVLTIGEVLRLDGYIVDLSVSGADAAERLRREEYDLVLTDLHMEDGDGISVLQEIRASSPFTIAVVLTGFASVESAIAALRHGAYDYLLKPCNIEELKLTVRRGLEHRRLMLAERAARASLEYINQELERRVEERTRELQRVNDELLEANRAKDVFLATLSHELRTPLTPVLGWVNLLRSGHTNVDATLLNQGLEAIERNARLQARLVDDLLDISRIISGKLRIEWEPVNLCEIVAATVEMALPEATARKVTLNVEIPDTPLIVQGAPVRLQQITWNLLTNAVKFTPDGGRVSLRVSREDAEASIHVEDTGVGIAPEFLPYVFDRFRQADGSTTRQFGGLGLGLAIVRALAELHGGRVSVESEGEGKGARFTFRLPCAAAPQTESETRVEEEFAPPDTSYVLVVDDSVETVELLHMLFTRRGFPVSTADSAAEALKQAGDKLPGVVISDISMPEVDGYDLIAQLRRIPGMESVPAIALSGYAMDEDRTRALAAGFTVHLAKPVDPEELVRVVRRLTSQASSIHQ